MLTSLNGVDHENAPQVLNTGGSDLSRGMEAVKTGVQCLREAIRRHAKYTLAKSERELNSRDLLHSCALSSRESIVDVLLETEKRYDTADAKRLYYLSMEFLMGRSLGNNLQNLGIYEECWGALEQMGFDLDEVMEHEPDAALGNGGLGRLAACFLDSLATLGMPGFGYGINYEYGLFKQRIVNGNQEEVPDGWRLQPSPWLIERPDEVCVIPVYGNIEHAADRKGEYNPMWMNWSVILGLPSDMPVVGYGGRTVNYLRLYTALSPQGLDLQEFQEGDYIKAAEQQVLGGLISKVLYPSDQTEAGRELRFVQEYFLVACAIRDIISRYQKGHAGFIEFPSKVAIQLNDTHPALTVAELMRVLIDENDIEWAEAWEITVATLGYTNHTLMPEALERWPVQLFERVLPRHLQIIVEINRRFLEGVARRWPRDSERLSRMSIVEDGETKNVRMANLAIVGSHSVNGVARLHSDLVKRRLAPDFYELWPERFNNKTNGVTQRRWLLGANPGLASLITREIGGDWVVQADDLIRLESYASDPCFQAEFAAVKRANKERLAALVKDTNGIAIDAASLFDVHAKRFHEYKRQLLNVLRIIHDYLTLVEDGRPSATPRTYIFAGKAAPGYWQAKQIIKLVNNVAQVVNTDPRSRDLMKVVMIPDYRVSLAEVIIPAADLAEHISTAGMEASGTSNMKFAMNGALTVGTLDGSNIEIMDEVGPENIFIFGLTADEIQGLRDDGSYCPRDVFERDSRLKRVLDTFVSDRFCKDEPGIFTWIFDTLNSCDPYFNLADFSAFIQTQDEVAREFQDESSWTRKAVLNVARIGRFSSDRTILEYAQGIWDIAST